MFTNTLNTDDIPTESNEVSKVINSDSANLSSISVGFYDNTCILYTRSVFMPWDAMFGKFFKQFQSNRLLIK